jgi:hypothetical protein
MYTRPMDLHHQCGGVELHVAGCQRVLGTSSEFIVSRGAESGVCLVKLRTPTSQSPAQSPASLQLREADLFMKSRTQLL